MTDTTPPNPKHSDNFITPTEFLQDFQDVPEATATPESEEIGTDYSEANEKQDNKMTEAEAIDHTTTLINMRESCQALLLAKYVDNSFETFNQYFYKPFQKELLINAWRPIIQNAGFKVSPWVNVLYAEGVSTAPLIITAFKARKYRKLYEAQLEENKNLMKKQEFKETVKSVKKQRNYGNKNAWKIDSEGLYEYSEDGTQYLKKGERIQRPNVSDAEVLKKLIEVNGKERVKTALEIEIE